MRLEGSRIRLVTMEFDDSLASSAHDAPQHPAPARPRVPGDLERVAPPVVAGELVAAITHDLRQPLTAIEMNVSAAIALLGRSSPKLDEAMDALQDALEQERRMRDALQVLENLAIRREPQHERFDLGAMIREVAALVNTDAVARGVPLEIEVSGETPSVSGDTLLVRQALLNIVLHALEAASSGRVALGPVRVAVRPADWRGGSSSAVTARDGAGAVEVSITHFGERGDAPDVAHWGLALARSVVRAHGATIAFEGDAATGVVVVTRWPTRPPEAAPLPNLADA